MAFNITEVVDRASDGLSPAIDPESKAPAVATVPGKDKRLAVCESGSALVLARESKRGVIVDVKTRKRDRDKGTETYWKATASLADWRDAVALKLVTF